MKLGDIMSIRFSPVNTWDWTCVSSKDEVIVLESPGGKREIHILPMLKRWEREGKVELKSRWGMR